MCMQRVAPPDCWRSWRICNSVPCSFFPVLSLNGLHDIRSYLHTAQENLRGFNSDSTCKALQDFPKSCAG